MDFVHLICASFPTTSTKQRQNLIVVAFIGSKFVNHFLDQPPLKADHARQFSPRQDQHLRKLWHMMGRHSGTLACSKVYIPFGSRQHASSSIAERDEYVSLTQQKVNCVRLWCNCYVEVLFQGLLVQFVFLEQKYF